MIFVLRIVSIFAPLFIIFMTKCLTYIKKLITTILLSLPVITAIAEEHPMATLKAEYDYTIQSLNTKTGERSPYTKKFVLQIAPGVSYYYNPQTHFVDSMENDPHGKLILDQAWTAAYHAFGNDRSKDPFKIMEEQGFIRESRYRCLKDFSKGSIRVWDSNMGDKYRYDIEMADLNWELGDSTKNVMGYECQLAIADYHGRKWHAWFTPEIPSQDGPWQLCGLPGLILEASCEGGLHSFIITGLQQCSEPLKPSFENDKYFITKRKSVLKNKDYSRRNRAAQISAMTQGAVKISDSVNYKGEDDSIELDYHE